MHIFQEIERQKKEKRRTKIDDKSYVFWDFDFGWILGGGWGAKILNFRTFFDVLAMSFFERDSKGEKNGRDVPTRRSKRKFVAGLR